MYIFYFLHFNLDCQWRVNLDCQWRVKEIWFNVMPVKCYLGLKWWHYIKVQYINMKNKICLI